MRIANFLRYISLRRLIFFCLFIGSFSLYVRTLAPSVLPADSGEFQFASYILGIVHPTGYPLYLLLAKLFTFLPVGDIAYRVNLMSAFWASLAVAFTFLISAKIAQPQFTNRRVNKPQQEKDPVSRGKWANFPSYISASAAAITLAISQTFWSQAVEAEVYSLNSLIFVLLLWLLLLLQENRSRVHWVLPAIGLVIGLGLAHHRTIILFLPAVTLFLILVLRQHTANESGYLRSIKRHTWGLSLSLLLTPLLLYLYIPLRADSVDYLNIRLADNQYLVLYQNSFSGFLRQITGSGFAYELGTGLNDGMAIRLAMFWQLTMQQFGLWSIFVGIIGTVVLAVKQTARFLYLMLSILGLLTFAMFYGIGDISDLLTPIYIVVSICIAAGLQLAMMASVRIPAKLGTSTTIVLSLLLLSTLSVSDSFARNDHSGSWQTREGWESLLHEPIEPGAILATNDRDEMVPLWYFQQVDGYRKDLVGLFPMITNSPEHADIMRLLNFALSTGRPVYLIKQLPEVSLKFKTVQVGSLVKVIGNYSEERPPVELSANFDGKLLLRGLEAENTNQEISDKKTLKAKPGDTVEFALLWNVIEPPKADYSVFVHLLDSQNQLATQEDIRLGGTVYPTSRWLKGESLVSHHKLVLQDNLKPGTYELSIGVYDSQTMKRLPTTTGSDTVIPSELSVE